MYGWSRIVREMKKVDRGPERLGLQQKKERWLLQKDKQSLDLQESRVIKDQDGNVLTIEESRYLSAAPFRGRHSASSAFISVYPKHPSPFCVTCCVSILVTFNEKVSILTSSTQTHIHLCFIGKCKWDCFFKQGCLLLQDLDLLLPGVCPMWQGQLCEKSVSIWHDRRHLLGRHWRSSCQQRGYWPPGSSLIAVFATELSSKRTTLDG